MVQLPTETFLDSISNRRAYYFSSNQLNTTIPHHFICIKRTDSDLLFMSCCTSRFDTVRRYVESRNLPFETLVNISPEDESNPFDLETYINCNDVQTYSVEEFRTMYESGSVNFSGTIGESSYEQILTGIHCSPLVEEETKDQIPTTILE